MSRPGLALCGILFALLGGCSDTRTAQCKDDGGRPFEATFHGAGKAWLLEPDDGCGLTWSPDAELAPLIVRVFAIRKRTDDSVEALLGREPDGARQWILGVFGPGAKAEGEGQFERGGQEQTYYRLLGRPPGVRKEEREILITRWSAADHYITLVAYYFQDEREQRQATALQIFQRLEVAFP